MVFSAFMMTLPVRPASGILYMEIWGRGVIPLTCTDEKFFTPREINKELPNWPISCVFEVF
jgi:hypothetical protein